MSTQTPGPPTVRVRLVVPHRDGRRVLATGTDLPSLEVVADPTTIAATVETLPTVDLAGPVIECIIDVTPDHELTGRREALVQLPPHDDAAATGDRRWIEWDQLQPVVPETIAAIARDLTAEARGLAAPHPRRIEWAHSGWYPAATDWIRQRLQRAGRADPTAIVQFRHWGISAVMRVDAPDGRSWFKASYPRFAHEGAVTAHLATTSPAGVPSVVAVEPSRGWMLIDDLGPTETTSPVEQAAAVERLVSIQAEQSAHLDRLADLGCPARPISELTASLDAALDSDVVAHLAIDPTRRKTLLDGVSLATDRVLAAGVPTTLVHGDFHPGNTATTATGPVIFDWTDACVSSPVVDLATWAWWYSNDAERQIALWNWFTDAWARHLDVDVRAVDRRSVDAVAGAFHVVSYAGLIEAVEPRRRFECTNGIDHFLGVMESAIQSG